MTINTQDLGNAIKRKRESLGMSLRDVYDQCGVSASTLSRIENGTGVPDADNVAKLSGWLDTPADRFFGSKQDAVIYYPHEPTPEIVRAILMADKKLSKGAAEGLAELFDCAYRNFVKG